METESLQHHPVTTTCQCLKIPLAGMMILVPRVLVAEVMELSELQLSSSLCPEIRYFAWRGYQVPLLAPGVLGCHERVLNGVASRILVFHGLQQHDRVAYWGLPVSANPTLVMVGDDDIVLTGEDALADDMLTPVRLVDENCHILRVDPVELFIQKGLIRQVGPDTFSRREPV